MSEEHNKSPEIPSEPTEQAVKEDAVETTAPAEVKLSKKKQKKLLRKQQKEEYWNSSRKEIRKKRREKAKERNKELGVPSTHKKKRTFETIKTCGYIGIDCDFDSYMNERETKSLYNQIQLLYGENWKLDNPFNIRCFGVDGKLLERVDKGDARKWKLLSFESEKIETIKNDIKCVYLTAESDNILESIDSDTYYIIGGIVDHNKYKGLCDGKAKSLNIPTARLPINENVEIVGRQVLTVNQVFNILSSFEKKKNWKDALEDALPSRKIVDKEEKGENEADNKQEESKLEESKVDDKK